MVNGWGKSKKQYEPVTRTGKNCENLLLHCYVLYEKTIVAGRKQPLRGVSRKQLILNCRKDRLLTVWKPLKNTDEAFLRNYRTKRRGLNRLNFKKRIRSPEAQNLPPRGVLQNHCVKSAQIRSISLYSIRMQVNTDQKKLRIRTFFTQWIIFLNIFSKIHLMHDI